MRKVFGFILALLLAEVTRAQEAPEGLFIGSKAPDFRCTDNKGQDIRLKDLLKKGKVVLVFYRGYWCPFCNRELSRFQDSLEMITQKGAQLIAVSPETKDKLDSTAARTGAGFSLVSDEGLKIMKAYDVDFEMEESTVTRYRNAGIDILKVNGANANYLPVPAVYIIDKESTIRYRFFNSDYRKRPSVKELLDNL